MMATIQHTWQPLASGQSDSYTVYKGTESGNEAAFATVPGTQTTYSHARAAGRGGGIVNRYLAGSMVFAAAWSRVLTIAEITQLSTDPYSMFQGH